MNAIKMIVGLANPKKKYDHTRHNVGSWYIQSLINKYGLLLIKEKKFFGFTSLLKIYSKNIRILVPDIFMNINGYSVYKMASFYNINLNEILIIHDDLDLKPGSLKLTYSYGHSGHNGLRNTLHQFSDKIKFLRFRIGIGRPMNKSEISSFVLSCPSKIEKILIDQAILYAINKTVILVNSQNIKNEIKFV